jgi:hypothetical protein
MGAGCWVLGPGFRVLGAGSWVLGPGFQVLGPGKLFQRHLRYGKMKLLVRISGTGQFSEQS